MGTLTPVRFVRAWQHYIVGQVITPTGAVRQELIRRGFAVPHEGKGSVAAGATEPPKRRRPPKELKS
jgi:hypothetical protein